MSAMMRSGGVSSACLIAALESELRKHGLELPHEIWWEYACRAGTTTPWWCGDEVDDLEGCANLLDAFARKHAPWSGDAVTFSDGRVVHAPVGSYRANGFGLHDVHGNVNEWCSNLFEASSDRVVRGGSYFNGPGLAASACRSRGAPDVRYNGTGIRPARQITRHP